MVLMLAMMMDSGKSILIWNNVADCKEVAVILNQHNITTTTTTTPICNGKIDSAKCRTAGQKLESALMLSSVNLSGKVCL